MFKSKFSNYPNGLMFYQSFNFEQEVLNKDGEITGNYDFKNGYLSLNPDGTSTIITKIEYNFPQIKVPNKFTLYAKIFIRDTGSVAIFSTSGYTSIGNRLNLYASNTEVNYSISSAASSISYTVPRNEWVDIFFIVDDNIQIYINSELIYNVSYGYGGASHPLNLLYTSTLNDSRVDIKNFMMWNRGLTLGEIKSIIKSNKNMLSSSTSNLISHYKCNGNFNNTYNNLNGTIYNGVTSTIGKDNIPDTAMLFNGIDGYVDLNLTSINNIFIPEKLKNGITISFWFKMISYGSQWDWILSKAYTSHTNPYYQFDIRFIKSSGESNKANLSCVWYGKNQSINISAFNNNEGELSLDTWYFVAISITQKRNILYIKGDDVTVEKDIINNISLPSLYNFSSGVYLGRNINIDSSGYYHGNFALQDLKFYQNFKNLTDAKGLINF